jgi:hypothetical protein
LPRKWFELDFCDFVIFDHSRQHQSEVYSTLGIDMVPFQKSMARSNNSRVRTLAALQGFDFGTEHINAEPMMSSRRCFLGDLWDALLPPRSFPPAHVVRVLCLMKFDIGSCHERISPKS